MAARTQVWLVATLLAVLPLPAFAGVADDVIACKDLNLQACPALGAAAASRKDGVAALGLAVQDAKRPAADRGKLAMALALLDARDQLAVLDIAAKSLEGQPEQVEILAAMARLGGTEATAGLLGFLKQTADLRSRLVAAAALGQLRAKEARPELLAGLAATQPPRLQKEAAVALGRIAAAEDEAALLELAGRPKAYPPARAAALDALANLGSAKGAVLAVLTLDSPQRDTGRAGLRLLQKTTDAKALEWSVPAIAFALDTPGLRAEAARLVMAKPHPDLHTPLLRAAVADALEPDEFTALVGAVVQLKPMGGSVGLTQHLRKLPPDRQTQVLRALAEMKDPATAKELVPWLVNPDPVVAGHVVYALQAITGKKHGNDLLAWRKETGLEPPEPAPATGRPAAAPTLVPAKTAKPAPPAGK